MAEYKIELTHTAEKQLRKISKRDLPRIIDALQMLAVAPLPQGCRKLSGYSHTYRVRIGVYRIIYELLNNILTVQVLKIGHRKDIYR